MKIYVTFGQVHAHHVNGQTLDKDCVAVLEAESHERGRALAWDLFGPQFFTTYAEDQWQEERQLAFYPRGYVYL